MEAEIAKSVVADDHLNGAPEEDKYGRYALDRDYVRNGQIMVTITLAEYRDLVRKNADDEVNKERSARYEISRERDELKKQVEELRKQLNDLRGMIASAVPLKTPDPGDE